ncbi:hypothetical protein T439DRAFT_320261 [Meredithblackwellia eburnea MCA 4105]
MAVDVNWMQNSGDPSQNLDKTDIHVIYDGHQYVKYTSTQPTRAAYLKFSCSDDRSSSNSPTIVGEFSLSPADETGSEFSLDREDAPAWYLQWFSSQVLAYEKHTAGWCFWSWKTDLGDPRWDYRLGVQKGFIPKALGSISNTVCSGV